MFSEQPGGATVMALCEGGAEIGRRRLFTRLLRRDHPTDRVGALRAAPYSWFCDCVFEHLSPSTPELIAIRAHRYLSFAAVRRAGRHGFRPTFSRLPTTQLFPFDERPEDLGKRRNLETWPALGQREFSPRQVALLAKQNSREPLRGDPAVQRLQTVRNRGRNGRLRSTKGK